MLYLAIIFHMHQPYYKNLLTKETEVPWVRLHGIKDYLDMVQILERYPAIHQTINMVPSLLEQVEDYTQGNVIDKFLGLSYKPAAELTQEDKDFLLERFFSIDRERCIAAHPRYYELYFRKFIHKEFTTQDFLDLQVWFNLAWTDPTFRESIPAFKRLVAKGRLFTEEEKRAALDEQVKILDQIIPTYKRIMGSGQLEVALSPFYHPILPLLYNTKLGKEANPRAVLPGLQFAHPEDAKAQIDLAIAYYRDRFGMHPTGMWPSEESVCEHIVPYFIDSGVNWIITDEAILYKSLHMRKRNTELLYQPHRLDRKGGSVNIIFRDRNLSDLIGFTYHHWQPKDAVKDLLGHLENINKAYSGRDILVPIAMDGENAWEYYTNDGHDFLNELYSRLSESKFIKTTTVKEYTLRFPPKNNIKRLAAGSWIYGEFGKWIGNPYKNKGWEYLALARKELQKLLDAKQPVSDLVWKQMHICEGSDWFWWLGEDPNGDFDRLYRMHLRNFYTLIDRPIPDYLHYPITP